MGTNILPFEGKNLPAYLKNVDRTALNNELISSGAGFPVISIKGKTFAIVRGGEREILPNPKDPDSPATSIDVVILKATKGLSKVYYAKKYEDGGDDKPTCYSSDGITPNADAEEIQSPKCAICKQNVWGSRISDSGKKGRACADTKRLAVTTPDQLNEPYLIRVPPASLSNLTEYGQYLAKRNVHHSMVVTKVSFDPAAATPKLVFKVVGLLDDAGYEQVQEALKLEVVDQIVGIPNDLEQAPAAAAAPAAKTEAPPPVTGTLGISTAPVKAEAVAKKVIEQAQAKPEKVVPMAAKPAPAVQEPNYEDVEVDLDNLAFDD
jgi:hypothetical protein